MKVLIKILCLSVLWFSCESEEKKSISDYDKIISGNYYRKKIKSKGTFHKSSQLPKDIKTWNIKISDYLKNYTN